MSCYNWNFIGLIWLNIGEVTPLKYNGNACIVFLKCESVLVNDSRKLVDCFIDQWFVYVNLQFTDG